MRGITLESAATIAEDLSEEMSHPLLCIHSLLYRGHFVSKSMRRGAVKGFEKYDDTCRQKDVLFDSQRSPTLLAVPLEAMPVHSTLLRCFEVQGMRQNRAVRCLLYLRLVFPRFDAWRFDTKPIDAHPLYNVTR